MRKSYYSKGRTRGRRREFLKNLSYSVAESRAYDYYIARLNIKVKSAREIYYYHARKAEKTADNLVSSKFVVLGHEIHYKYNEKRAYFFKNRRFRAVGHALSEVCKSVVYYCLKKSYDYNAGPLFFFGQTK